MSDPRLDEPARLIVVPTVNGSLGRLDGPFELSLQAMGGAHPHDADADILAAVVSFVRLVAAGVSCYNKNAIENSSNLRSYAEECMYDLKSEAPEVAARLENLIVDCSGLPNAVRSHPIWKLDRAILRMLPGIKFLE